MKEQFITVKDFPNYEVSNLGRIRNTKTGKFLKPTTTNGGYLRVWLYNDNTKKEHLVHRLVGMTFINNPLNKETINHINGIKVDNRIENLEWLSRDENTSHSHRTGLNTHFQTNNPNKDIMLKCYCVETGEEFESIAQCARSFKTHQSIIYQCIRKNHSWRGLHFKLS